MRTTIKFFGITPLLLSFILLINTGKAQNLTPGERIEKTSFYWQLVMQQVNAQSGASKQEYEVFNRFYRHTIDSVRFEFLRKIKDPTVTINAAKEYIMAKKPFLINLFNNFRKIEQEFPSSVDEYRVEPKRRVGGDSCFASCNNTDFEDGTLNGWYGYYAENNSNTSNFIINSITGGYCGPVTQAGGPDPLDLWNDYQIRITSGSATDPFLNTYSTHSMPEVSPWGGLHSVMLGDSNKNELGTAILSQSFLVSQSNSSLTYQYAVFLENPKHNYYEQPFFSVAIVDQNGDTIPTCGLYQVDAGDAGANHFTAIYYPTENDTVFWKDWTIVNVPLKRYIGQCVTVVFQVQDCSQGGHFGYAYVDASCSPAGLLASSPNFCGQDSITLSAPPGATSYRWKGPLGKFYTGIRGSDSGQVVSIDSPGVYEVITIPVTGAFCADTIYDTIGKLPGPFPHPRFTADSVCNGQPMTFINLSHPDSGLFSWDFYDIGIYNYNNLPYKKDTSWTYASPGTYTVKLHQLANGCGLDTVIKVTTFGPPVASISPATDTICIGDTAVLKGSGTGVYQWSTGSTATSVSVHPTKTTMYHLKVSVKNSSCFDTVSALVYVRAPLVGTISHDTSICPNQPVTLKAHESGEPPAGYIWSTGATTSSIQVAPSVTTGYTAVVSGLYCYHDTLKNTVTVVPPPVNTISGPDWRCKGVKDTITISSTTNPTIYIWDNGSTKTTRYVGPINADSVITVIAINSLGCADTTSYTISLRYPPTPSINPPIEFCAGQPLTLSAGAQGSDPPFVYTWSTGQTGSSINITGPDTATTYSVKVSNGCIGSASTTVIPNVPYLYACCTKTIIINNDTTILVAGGNSTKYQWQEDPDKGTITCLDSLCDSVRVITPVTTSYTVIGTDALGCQGEDVLLVNVDVPCFQLILPNVITPSSPGPLGLNSMFYIKTVNMDAWSIKIFDRWGKEVFSTTDQYQYWTGNTESGAEAVDGVYYYVISATCQNATYKKDGFIQLIR